VGVFLIISFLVAPLAAIFYGEPLLRQIIPFLSIGVLASPVNIVHKAQLIRKLDFKKTAFISNASHIFAGLLSLILAFLGMGVWALVFNSVASIFVAMPLYFRATGYIPKFVWDKQAFKDVFGFGVYTTGSHVFNVVISKMDYLLIGKLLSASALGAYTLAFVLTDSFRSQLMGIINKVMYPLYGQKQDDPKILKAYYLQVVKFNSLLICPIMILLVALGEPIILNFFGAKWQETIMPLQILSLSVIVHMTVSSHSSLIRGLGLPRLDMKLQLFKAVFLYAPLISAGVFYYGIVGAASAFLVSRIFETAIAQYYLKKLVNVSYADLFASIKVPFFATLCAYLSVQLLIYLGVHFILSGFVLGITYGAVIWLFMRKEILKQINEYRSAKKAKGNALKRNYPVESEVEV
jgi:teichuronic acid exporter